MGGQWGQHEKLGSCSIHCPVLLPITTRKSFYNEDAVMHLFSLELFSSFSLPLGQKPQRGMQGPASSDTSYFPAASTHTTALQTACEINCLHSQTLIALNLASGLLPRMSLPYFSTRPTLLLTFEDPAQASLPPGSPPSYLLTHFPPNAGLGNIFWAPRVSSADPTMVLVSGLAFSSAYVQKMSFTSFS